MKERNTHPIAPVLAEADNLATIATRLLEAVHELEKAQLAANKDGSTTYMDMLEYAKALQRDRAADMRFNIDEYSKRIERYRDADGRDTRLIAAANAALHYIAAIHGAEVPMAPFDADLTASALAGALNPYKTPHGREVDCKMVTAISTAQQQAEPVAESVPDAAIGKLRVLLAACNRIEEEAEELEGPDGLGMSIAMDYWHEFAETLTTARKALAALQKDPRQTFAEYHLGKPFSMPDALSDIAAERRRQIEAEGWTPEHDDQYQHGEMARAAACYALQANSPLSYKRFHHPSWWPFSTQWWKPSTTRRDLVKAGALITAEIERIDRAAQKGGAA